MTYAVEIQLQLIKFLHDSVEACDLCVGVVNDIACPIILLQGDDGALLAQIVNSQLYLLHQSVEVRRKSRQARAVEEQSTLG